MRAGGRAVLLGSVLAVVGLVAGLAAVTPAVAQDPPPPVAVIPGGPSFVLQGPYSGSESSGPGDFSCPQPSQAPFRYDFVGSFTHPSLGAGTYQFHVRVCIPTEAGVKVAKLPGTFVLNGSDRSLSGALSFKGFHDVDFVAGTASYEVDLTAGGACTAHFRADGQVTNFFANQVGDDSGTLQQIGAIVCRLH